MAAVIMFHGNPLMVDYTPGTAVSAGDVVELGDVPFIAHNAIAANDLGAVAAGGGVYKATSDGTVDNPGVKIYWDDTAGKITTTAAANTHFGFSSPDQGASDDGDIITVIHAPSTDA